MTNIFDQFEQSSQRSTNNSFSNVELITSGYIHIKKEQDAPIFSKSKRDFTPSDKITHVAISNKYMVIAMANGILFRMNLHQPNQQDEISISRYKSNGRLTNLFLDHTGNHLLLSFAAKGPDSTSELLYLHRKSTKLKASQKLRGHEITEVAWNHLNDLENTTGSILLGTSKGLIFETEIVPEGDKFFPSGFSSSLEQYWKQIFDIGKGNNIPIRGMEYFRIPGTDTYNIYVATPNRLYFFTGKAYVEDKPLLQQVFNRYLNIPEIDTYVEVFSKTNYSKLRFWPENQLVPNSLIWMMESESYYLKFDPESQKSIKSLTCEWSCIKNPNNNYEESQRPPSSVTLTEFHVLFVYSDTIKGVSLLNKEIVYEDNYNDAFGRLVDVIKDCVSGTIWAVTENALFKFKITKEERNVWKFYCDNKQFDLAKRYAKENEVYYNQVLVKEADMLFENGDYELSAQCYAETQSSFEEICLKFIQADKQEALKLFLRKKLDNIKPQDKTQITMIVIWLLELYLTHLEKMRLAEKEQTNAFAELQKEFEAFLALPVVSDCVRNNKSTFYELMASHGDKMNLIKLTIVSKDFEKLIRQHIYKSNFLEALEVLKSQDNRELFYHFTPILIKEIPKLMVKALIDQKSNLSPVKLLPAFVNCDREYQSMEVIKYLEFCVDKLKNSDKAIHNLLLSLYVKYDEGKLMSYLNSQGQDILMVNYDVHFALRLCQEKKLKEPCVQLSAILGLWESAVDMALEVNVELAKQIANLPPQQDVELRKKLWLKIAKHIVSGKEDIAQAMDFLHQCELIRIEDILPFFSDFVTIDHFKDAICNSLKEYNQQIQDLKEEMEEATRSAEIVRKEIQNFRNRHVIINNTDTCDICELTLLVKPFYMFPCRHHFHTDCLLSKLNPFLGPATKNKLADLQRQLNVLNNQSADNISTGSSGISKKDHVLTEIDSIIASECLYCGENMIRTIDMPFIEDSEFDRIMKEWE